MSVNVDFDEKIKKTETTFWQVLARRPNNKAFFDEQKQFMFF